MKEVDSEFNRRVLIVDDNPAIHDDFKKVLSAPHDDEMDEEESFLFGDETPRKGRSLDFEIDSAFQGREGLEKVVQAAAEGSPYALAFVDVRMPPGWDGIETIERIWELHPELQVVICTAYSDYSWDDVLRKLGKQDGLLILKKPFDNIEVRQLATALSQKWHLKRLADLKLGDLECRVEKRTRQLQQRTEDLERQVAERLKIEKQLRHNATHDTLTDLPNRALFIQRLAEACEKRSRLPGYSFAIAFLDLDRFKMLNDGLGHAIGDLFLIETAQRVSECLRPGDTVARLGGDEFTFLFEGLADDREAIQAAQRVQSTLREPFLIAGQELFTTASIGIALGDSEHLYPPDLLRDADTAMYEAKSVGMGGLKVFDAEMRESAVNTLRLETDLQRAVERGQLRLDYQPIFDLGSGLVKGAEALVRWDHPELGLLAPRLFIPLAEETGLINSIGDWVLTTACRQNRLWQNQGRRPLYVSVNVSATQFRQNGFLGSVDRTLQESGLDARWLKLELTESALMSNSDQVITTLESLRRLGVSLAIDDFGTGYSSMSYLQDLPVDTLKIDQSFIKRTRSDATSPTNILKALTALAHNLNMEVTVEGVENRVQLEVIRSLGCVEVQGFFLGRPGPPEQMVAQINKKWGDLEELKNAVAAESDNLHAAGAGVREKS